MLITEDLEDAEVQEGSSATFSCRISPADYEPVRWFLDKTPLHANELNEIEVQPGGYHVLTLRQLALKDSGTVYFEAGDQRTSAALRVTGAFRGILWSVWCWQLKELHGLAEWGQGWGRRQHGLPMAGALSLKKVHSEGYTKFFDLLCGCTEVMSGGVGQLFAWQGDSG